MDKVTGVGGVFFKARDAQALRRWYREQLGVPDDDGAAFYRWRDAARPDVLGGTVFAVFAESSRYFEPGAARFMVNLRVADLDATLARLRAAGVVVKDHVERSAHGAFGWALDPEDNLVELWQPPPSERAGVACYVVDAFTRVAFAGNPAAVCPVPAFPPDAWMLALAAENALSETAYVAPRADGDFDLRWFTPVLEVDLCGHATLATAHVLLTVLEPARERVRFHTRSGPLEVTRDGDALTLDLPRRSASPLPAVPAGVALALGAEPVQCFRSSGGELVARYARAEDVRALRPDFARVAALEGFRSAMVTAPGTGPDADVDFVTRYFSPKGGVPEDPVTGSAHCTLTPLWSARLGKDTLRARQVSRRGGELLCQRAGERVRLTGHAVLVKSGVVHAAPPG